MYIKVKLSIYNVEYIVEYMVENCNWKKKEKNETKKLFRIYFKNIFICLLYYCKQILYLSCERKNPLKSHFE